MSRTIRVGILGATGTVGQRFVQMLESHPQFTVTALAASDRSVGKPYGEAMPVAPPGRNARGRPEPRRAAARPPLDCDVVFSSLPGDVAREAEGCFAAAGVPVVSNSSSYRMDADVPLLVPEVNADHLVVLDGRTEKASSSPTPTARRSESRSRWRRSTGVRRRGVRRDYAPGDLGAGYPGVPAMEHN